MPSPSVERLQRFQYPSGTTTMKKIWFALVFFLGGFAHELRNPVSCQCLSSRPAVMWRLRRSES
jgi:hypothetical protein